MGRQSHALKPSTWPHAGQSVFPWRKGYPGTPVTMPSPGAGVFTVGDLLEQLDGVDPSTRIQWMVEGPDECCPGHAHDITLTVDHIAEVIASRYYVGVTLSEGNV